MNEKEIPVTGDENMDINSDSEMPGNSHLNDPLGEESLAVEKLELQLEEQKDKFLRQAAEFENFKRRTAKERMELLQTAGKEIISSLLDVLDDCDRAEIQMEKTEDIAQVKQGTILVFNKLRSILQQKGLKDMDSMGAEFDVEKHEAITQIEAGAKMEGKVVDVMQKGYYLNDKLIRFAKVVVGK